MFGRLWWKEARQFGPAWLLVAVATLGGIVLASVILDDHGDRAPVLGELALLGTCLYGLAASSASFSGERESRTLMLLDTLPAPRGRVWGAKASFVMASTMALALSMLLVSWSCVAWKDAGPLARVWTVVAAFAVVAEAVAWGLFWSSLLESSLGAAALAVCSALLGVPVLYEIAGNSGDLGEAATGVRVGVVVMAMMASAFCFVSQGPPRRPWRWSIGWGGRRSAGVAGPATLGRSGGSWPRAVSSLAWQTSREVGPVWLGLAGLVLGVPLALHVLSWLSYGRGELVAVLPAVNTAATMLAGVSVFATEQPGRSYRFLAHHGVRPGLVWLVKNGVWLTALALLWGLALLLVMLVPGLLRQSLDAPGWQSSLTANAVILAGCYTVGQLCGMALRRGITAVLVAIISLVILAFPITAAVQARLVPVEWLMALPVALLAVCWEWTGPWMLDRPGAAKWLRLAGLMAVAAGLLAPAYVGARVWGVRDVGPAPRVASTSVADGRAARLYEEASEQVVDPYEVDPPADWTSIIDVISKDGDSTGESMRAWLGANAGPLEVIRRASGLPLAPSAPLETRTVFNEAGNPLQSLQFTLLVGLSAREREVRGDLAGSWSDILVMLRMSRQQGGPVTLFEAREMLKRETWALDLALRWSTDPGQTRELLRSALRDYNELPPPPSMADVLAVDQTVLEQSLQMPGRQLREQLVAMSRSPNQDAANVQWLWSNAVTTPWERQRAIRAVRLIGAVQRDAASRVPPVPFASAGDLVILPGEGVARVGPGRSAVTKDELERIVETTPLLRTLLPSVGPLIWMDRANEVARRALPQVLALRSWQIGHGGRLPSTLEELVPEELERLPADPYRPAKPFGYTVSSGQWLPRLGVDARASGGLGLAPEKESRILYSVGVNRQDESGIAVVGRDDAGDIVFVLPDGPAAEAPGQP